MHLSRRPCRCRLHRTLSNDPMDELAPELTLQVRDQANRLSEVCDGILCPDMGGNFICLGIIGGIWFNTTTSGFPNRRRNAN
jgi:hypothetical protein